MKQVRFDGPNEYRGFDPITKKSIVARTGHVLELSTEKTNQLLKDYPGLWTNITDQQSAPEPRVVAKQETIAVEKEQPTKSAVQAKKKGKR